MSTKYTTADDSTDSGWVQTGRTLLRCGWFVGKKVAIAGVAISVAPLAIPLLLVFSALGLALSVPFGIFYAGMVGIERLMQSLLPLGQGQEIRQGNQEESDEIVEEEKGYLGERESKYEEILERERDDEIVEEGNGYVGRRDYKPDENGEDGEDDDAIVEIPGEMDTVTEEHGERNKNYVVVESLDEKGEKGGKGKGNISNRGFKTEKAEEKDDNGVVEISKETVAGVEETRGMTKDDGAIVEIPVKMDASSKEHGGMNDNDGVKSLDERDEIVEIEKGSVRKRGFKPDENGAETGGMKKDDAKGETDNTGFVAEINGNNGTVDKDSITMEKVEIKPAEVNSTTLTEGMERAGAEEIQVETGNTDVVEEKELVVADIDSKVAEKGENELSTVISEADDVSEVEGKSDLADAGSQSSTEHVGKINDVNALASASAESPVTSDVEEFYTKKQLWDQVRALRIIVGYKVAIAKTLPDEMRALYVFTGVQLPSTATDASNLLDLNYKLQFLKSVIGVK